MLLIAPILAMSIVYELTKNQPRKYKSEAKLYLNLQENQATSLNGEGLKQYQVHTYFQNITELIKSKRTLARTKLLLLKRGLNGEDFMLLGLPNNPEALDAMRVRVMELEYTTLTPNSKSEVDSLILAYYDFHKLEDDRMVDMVSTYRLRDSNYLGFSLEEELAIKAQIMAECFIEALIEENKAAKIIVKNLVDGMLPFIKAATP